MVCGERGIPMPNPDPAAFLRVSPHAGFFARLCDDVLMDVYRAYRAVTNPNRGDCLLVDLVRAEFARRHAPGDRELDVFCDACGESFELHGEFMECPNY